MTKSTDREFWTERGISEAVREARPYEHWTTDDTSAVAGAYWGLSKCQRAYMIILARQSDGLIIFRHAVPGAPYVYPEIRPDYKVTTGPPVKH